MQGMSKIGITVLIAACSIGLWHGCRYWSDQLKEQARTQYMTKEMNRKVPVLYAVKDVHQGELVTSDMIEVRQIPSKDVPGGILWTPDLAVGLIAKHGCSKGCMFYTSHFGLDDSDPEFRSGLGEASKRMERAMQLQVRLHRSAAP